MERNLVVHIGTVAEIEVVNVVPNLGDEILWGTYSNLAMFTCRASVNHLHMYMQ